MGQYMKEFFSKLSLYDFLTTILLGGFVHFMLLLPRSDLYYGCLLDYIHNYVQSVNDICIVRSGPSSSINYTWVLMLCYYFMGLLIHRVVEWVDLSFATKNKQRGKFLSSLLSVVCRNTKSIIRYSLEKTLEDNPNKTLINMYGGNDMMFHYNEAYYKLYYSERLNNIPKIEAISAFSKDLLIVFLFLSLRFFTMQFYWKNLLIMIIVMSVFVVIRYNCERIISRLVWEGFFYGSLRVSSINNISIINGAVRSASGNGVNVKVNANNSSVSASADNGSVNCSINV